MYNKSNRKQAKIQTQNYNYLQDLYGNSGITTTDLQRRNTKRYKKINRKRKAQCTYEINNKRLRMPRTETNLQEEVSISYKEKISNGYKKLNGT